MRLKKRSYRRAFGGFVIGAGSLLAASGCSQSGSSADMQTAEPSPEQAVRAKPTLAELPAAELKRERTIAAKISVEDYSRASRHRIVPDYTEPPLSPEEKAALGEDKPKPGDELLAFYRPHRGTEHGVHPHESLVSTYAFGRGGAFVGLAPNPRSIGVYGEGGYYAAIDNVNQKKITSYDESGRRVGIGPESLVQSGEGTARQAATRQEQLD